MYTQVVTDECKNDFYTFYRESFHEDVPMDIVQLIKNDGVCIFSKDEKCIEGIVTISPLKDNNDELVLVSCQCASNLELSCKLIREGVMIAYEMGYKLALSKDTNAIFKKAGFEEVRSSSEAKEMLLAMELKWGALESFNIEDLHHHLRN